VTIFEIKSVTEDDRLVEDSRGAEQTKPQTHRSNADNCVAIRTISSLRSRPPWHAPNRKGRALFSACPLLSLHFIVSRLPTTSHIRLSFSRARPLNSQWWSRGVTRWFRFSQSVSDSFVCRCHELDNASVFTPRIEPDVRIFRFGLSTKGSRCRPRETARPQGKADEAQHFMQTCLRKQFWPPATSVCARHTITEATSCERVSPPPDKPRSLVLDRSS